MRAIVNISLPQTLKEEMESAVKKGGYATKSEFVRDLMRLWKEDRFLREVQESRKQIINGKGKTLKSLKNLR